VDHVDVFLDHRRVGVAFLELGELISPLDLRGPSAPTRKTLVRDCAHDEDARIIAYAYVRARDEHWPIEFCGKCGHVLNGLRPRSRGASGGESALRFDVEDVIAAKWRREWPKPGAPRRKRPPAGVAWPSS